MVTSINFLYNYKNPVCVLRLAPAFILIQKAYYDTLIEFRGLLGREVTMSSRDLGLGGES